MNNKKYEIVIKKICDTLELGTINSIEHIKNNQKIVYLVKTDNKAYYIKQYSKDTIKNDKDLLDCKRQIAVAEKFKENGVPAVLPLNFENRYFIKYDKDYYLIYDCPGEQPITEKDLDSKKIKKLANTLAIIHKLNIQSNLKCQYKKIQIDFNTYLKKYNKIDENLHKVLNDNYQLLEELINNCNNNISKLKENLCVCHNDYKLSNILWKKDYMYIIDFDATAMSNPTVSFAESAFSLSKQNEVFNKDFYKDFVASYTKKYGPIEEDFETSLNVAMNGKLQWLEYIMSKCSKKDKQSITDTINIIKELRLFIDSKIDMLTIYTDVVTNKKPKKKKRTKK